MLELEDLHFTIAHKEILRGISARFTPSGIHGIVGPNGSGKSTLLKILAGEEEPGGGSISVPRKTRLGVLRQDHFLYEEVPILDVVMMGHRELWEAMIAKERLLERAIHAEL